MCLRLTCSHFQYCSIIVLLLIGMAPSVLWHFTLMTVNSCCTAAIIHPIALIISLQCVHLLPVLLYICMYVCSNPALLCCVCLTPESITGLKLRIGLGLCQKAVTYTPITVLPLSSCFKHVSVLFVPHPASIWTAAESMCSIAAFHRTVSAATYFSLSHI